MAMIAAIGAVPAPAPTTSTNDMLAPMRGALDTAFAVGRPADRADAAAILATNDEFLAGAQQTLGTLDAQMLQRRERLAAGTGTPAQQVEDQEQLRLMQLLRDRIQLSIDRTVALHADDGDVARVQRAELLNRPMAPSAFASDPAIVARAYGDGARIAGAGR